MFCALFWQVVEGVKLNQSRKQLIPALGMIVRLFRNLFASAPTLLVWILFLTHFLSLISETHQISIYQLLLVVSSTRFDHPILTSKRIHPCPHLCLCLLSVWTCEQCPVCLLDARNLLRLLVWLTKFWPTLCLQDSITTHIYLLGNWPFIPTHTLCLGCQE